MELVANWGARPVFITSTFQDMQAERDWLWDFVFPAIEERLRRHRRHLEWIDLRLGASDAQAETEAEREAQVLKVCLDEVRRSRPFLIALIGDRYGWVPPRERADAAAGEVGIPGDVTGRSVTDLEIDFGVFRDPDQRRRSLFFLREALPYEAMGTRAARYADAYAPDTDVGAPDRVDRLDQLKDRIRREFPDHVHTYPAAWDKTAARVTGLEAFGKLVEEALWQQLEAELVAEPEPAELPWQTQEARALEAFAADRRRDFEGRTALLDDIAAFLDAPAQDGVPWAFCLTGSPGAGKSAVFGELMHRLEPTPALVLAHAAGASPRAPSVVAMLRRWIAELAAFLNETTELADNADAETVERSFGSLLGRAALRRRVLVLVDALDQFELTPRGRYLTWLPAQWPPNARLFATAIPREASAALAARAGVETRAMPALTEAEAHAVFAAIHLRYHRSPDQAVLEALLEKEQAGWSNPLWLHLAVEQVNLLDEDDVARAEQDPDPARSMGQRLRALLLGRVALFPTDLTGLYRFVFDHAARRFPALAPSFLGLIAVSAAGWRESDLRAVLQGLAEEAWDDLRFAYLRRLFRGQIHPRGALEQWDVAHAQMREALRPWLADRGVVETDLHAALAQHLLALADDPLRATETMRHLLAAGELKEAAEFYADPALPEATRAGTTQFLADAWLAVQPDLAVQTQLATTLALEDLSDPIVGRLANRLVADLHGAIASAGLLPPLHDLIALVQPVLARLVTRDPSNVGWQRDLSYAYDRLGDLLVAQGKLSEAHNSYEKALRIIEQYIKDQDAPLDLLYHTSSIYDGIGDVRERQGNYESALSYYKSALAMRERIASRASVRWRGQDILSVSYNKIGNVLDNLGDIDEALLAYKDALALRQTVAEQDPLDPELQGDLAACHDNIGRSLEKKADLEGALEAYSAGKAIRQAVASRDPSNIGSKRDLSVSLQAISGALALQGELQAALKAARERHMLTAEIASHDTTNLEWRYDLSVSHNRIASILALMGDDRHALENQQAAMNIDDELVGIDGTNLKWLEGSAMSHMGLALMLHASGDLDEALIHLTVADQRIQSIRARRADISLPVITLFDRLAFDLGWSKYL